MSFSQKKFELSPRLKSGVGRGQNQILKLAAIICLVLAVVLTLNAIRLIYSGKNSQVSESSNPQVLGASDVKQPSNPAALQFTSYTVQKNDTLFDISQKYNISWTTLATINNLKAPYNLKPGQILKVPKQ